MKLPLLAAPCGGALRAGRVNELHLLAAFVACLGACGRPSGQGPAEAAAPLVSEVQLEPALKSLQALVLEPACAMAGCHDATTQAGMLDLSSAEASYESLVGADGAGVAVMNAVAAENGWLRVRPGDPEGSFLYRKLKLPGAGEGAPMPVGDVMLSEPYMQALQGWIEQGAEP